MPSSRSFVVVSGVDVKEWLRDLPSVSRLRPDRCPFCHGPSRPVGGNLRIWGHGTRERLLFGVFALGESPRAVTIKARRFQCRHVDCGRTCTVLPRQALVHRRYLLPTVVAALAMWTLHEEALSTARIRARLSPFHLLDHHSEWTSWPQLFRWAEAADLRQVAAVDSADRHRQAERIAQAFAGRGPPSSRHLPLWRRAFLSADEHRR